MAPTIQELGLDRLSPEERLAVAEAIWDSVVQETESAALPPRAADGTRTAPGGQHRPA